MASNFISQMASSFTSSHISTGCLTQLRFIPPTSLYQLIIGIIVMETNDRHQIIKSLMAQHTEKVADAAINLWVWEQMATQIISIIGEGGFNSLYARSVFLAQSTFPWLATGPLSPQTDHRFAELKMSLEGQTSAQASAANSLLLITFTDILATLIGERLTTNILRLAWGSEELLAGHPNDALDRAGDEKLLSGHPKEFKNE